MIQTSNQHIHFFRNSWAPTTEDFGIPSISFNCSCIKKRLIRGILPQIASFESNNNKFEMTIICLPVCSNIQTFNIFIQFNHFVLSIQSLKMFLIQFFILIQFKFFGVNFIQFNLNVQFKLITLIQFNLQISFQFKSTYILLIQ